MPLERGQLVWLDINHGCSLIQFSCLMKMITVTSLYVGARARANKRTVDSTNTVLLPVLDSLLNIPIGKKKLTLFTDLLHRHNHSFFMPVH
jgi:hypothetical protein